MVGINGGRPEDCVHPTIETRIKHHAIITFKWGGGEITRIIEVKN